MTDAGTTLTDAGTTLTELLVGMVVFAVIAPLATGFLIGVQTQTRSTVASSANVADVRLALAYVERQVRSGNRPLTVAPAALSLLTCDDQTAPGEIGWVRVVEFRLGSGALQSRSYRASDPAGSWRTLVTGLDPATVFTPAGTDGVRLSVAVSGGHGRRAVGDTTVAPRNPALPTPAPQLCP